MAASLRGPADISRKRFLTGPAALVEMLYAQALLLGHQPLRSTEMELLNRGLTGLIELAVTENEASP